VSTSRSRWKSSRQTTNNICMRIIIHRPNEVSLILLMLSIDTTSRKDHRLQSTLGLKRRRNRLVKRRQTVCRGRTSYQRTTSQWNKCGTWTECKKHQKSKIKSTSIIFRSIISRPRRKNTLNTWKAINTRCSYQ
jgi:hypothetical protein